MKNTKKLVQRLKAKKVKSLETKNILYQKDDNVILVFLQKRSVIHSNSFKLNGLNYLF